MILLTQAEVAERLGITAGAVVRLRRAGALPYIPGKPILVDVCDLDAYQAELARVELEKAEKAAAAPRPPTAADMGWLRAHRKWKLRAIKSGR